MKEVVAATVSTVAPRAVDQISAGHSLRMVMSAPQATVATTEAIASAVTDPDESSNEPPSIQAYTASRSSQAPQAQRAVLCIGWELLPRGDIRIRRQVAAEAAPAAMRM